MALIGHDDIWGKDKIENRSHFWKNIQRTICVFHGRISSMKTDATEIARIGISIKGSVLVIIRQNMDQEPS